jgi:hypothetical protein
MSGTLTVFIRQVPSSCAEVRAEVHHGSIFALNRGTKGAGELRRGGVSR